MGKYVIDDGSLASKCLQYEYKDAQVIKVGKYNLNEWLVDIIEEDDNIKFVYLPFCSGDLIKPDVDIRTDIAAAMHNYPQLRIILPYEQMDTPSIERKALNYGIKSEVDKLIEDNKDKFKFVEYSDYGKYTVGGNDSVDNDIKYKAVNTKEVASDILSSAATGGHEAPSDEFVKKLEESKNKTTRRRKKKDVDNEADL